MAFDIVEKSEVVTSYPIRNHGSIENLLNEIDTIRKINPSVKFCGEYVEKHCRKNGITLPEDWKNALSDFSTLKKQNRNTGEAIFEVSEK